MSVTSYKAALIGCGRIGFTLGFDKKREQPASHTMALNDNQRINLIAGCDTDAVALNAWHESNKRALTYRESANLYARQKLDIITIAVNEEAHLKEAEAAICSQPRLVILEKPVALSVEEALKIKKCAEEYQVPVMVNHERRFAEDYILAKSYLPEIGELQSIRAALHSGMCVYSAEKEATGSYSLIHDGTHLVDAVLFFLEADKASDVEEVQVFKAGKTSGAGLLNRASGCAVETKTVSSILKNPLITGLYHDEKGNVRQLSAHYSTEKCPDVEISISGRSKFFGFEIEITGTKGKICIGNGDLRFYKSEKSSLYSGFYSLVPDKSMKSPKKTLYFANMVQNAVDFLDGRAELKSTLQNGINALAVLEEIREKLK